MAKVTHQISFHKNGKLGLHARKAGGRYHGLFQTWWPNGKPMSEEYYENGEPRLIRKFSRTGQLFHESVCDSGAVRQRTYRSRSKKWVSSYSVRGKSVAAEEYFKFLG